MKRSALLGLLCVLLIVVPVSRPAKAQGTIITATNAQRLAVSQRFGQGLVKEARWIAGGKYFAECAWTGIYL